MGYKVPHKMSRASTGNALLACVVLFAHACCAGAALGVLVLDTLTFDKIVGRDRPVVVAITEAGGYSEEWDAFQEAAAQAGSSNIMFAKVQIGVDEEDPYSSYYDGENIGNENDKIAARFKAESNDILFFPAKQLTPTKWKSSRKDKDALLGWIKDLGVYIGREGCLEVFDGLAEKFFAQEGDRVQLLQAAEDAVKVLQAEEDPDSQAQVLQAVVYTSIMKKVLKNGSGYIQTEKDRLNKIIEDDFVKEEKKEMFRK